MALRILVADKLAEEGLEFLRESKIAFDVRTGLKEDELAAIVGDYDALIVRSGAKVTANVLQNPGKLKIVARAGVGVDNIDLDAATAKGVLVLNTAEASTLSTAEHALALMFALARKIHLADVKVKSGSWDRALRGTQLAGKTLGVVGLGRIGRTLATRAIAMEMTVLGYDPYFSSPSALEGKVKMVRDFDEFLSQLDVVTFHVPGGESTRHLLNRERLFNRCKPNLLVINDARGEVVDTTALADALHERKIAGAAIDVLEVEPPPKDHPLLNLDAETASRVILTPHLGASTEEAQLAVSVEACKATIAYLTTGQIRGAVNAGGIKLDLAPDEAPFAELARRVGMVMAGLYEEGYKTITLRASGQRAPKIMNTLLRLATVELLKPHLDTPVNVINVEHLARQRGIEVVQVHEPEPPAGLVGDIIGVRVDSQNGESHRILGTVYADGLPRVLRIDNFAMDMIPEGQMVIIVNKDMPGVIGIVGTSFGDAQVNIADMVISREKHPDGSATALMVLKTDSAPPAALLNRLRARPNILKVNAVVLPER